MSDLIDRQAAIDAVTKYCLKYDLRELLADIECFPTADLSEYCDKLWETAYERGKAETLIIKLTEGDKESLKKAMKEAELTLVAEPRNGKWEIDVDHEYDVFDIAGERTWAVKATCSECGFTMRFIEGHGVFKYCPNCGARMEE